MRKSYKSVIFFIFTFLWFNSPAEAVFDFLKKNSWKCKGDCDDQSKVCNSEELRAWCKKNCSTQTYQEGVQKGFLLDGTCFKVLTYNPQQNATQVTADYARKQLAQCNARVTKSKDMINLTKGANAEALKKLIQQLDGIVRDLGTPISKKVGAEVQPEVNPKEYSGDLIAYIQGCNNLNDKINDFVQWSRGKIPEGGFKTVKTGSTKAQIDALFQKIITDNSQNNATLFTPDQAQQELNKCNKHVSDYKAMVSFIKGANAQVLQNLIGELEGPGASISAKISNNEDYSQALNNYISKCDNLNNKIVDFSYWARGLTPQGGFKTVKVGSSKAKIDAAFQRIIDDVNKSLKSQKQ